MVTGPIHIRTAAQHDAANERYLKAAREAFPGLEFHQVFGGWEAVPEGTPVIRGLDLDSIVEKLRKHQNPSRHGD